MTPGDRLRRLAARFCSAGTMERLVDPIVADLQAEHAAAIAAGRRFASRLVHLRGAAALMHALCVHALSAPGLREGRRAFAIAAVAFTACVALYLELALRNLQVRTRPNVAELALYLTPGALPSALSLAMLCGMAGGGAPSDIGVRGLRRLLFASLVPVLLAFAVSGWLVPAGNQAFRVAAAGRPVFRGVNELSLGELRAVLARTNEPLAVIGPRSQRVLEASYHARWMLGCLPLVAAAVGASVARRKLFVRVITAITFFGAYNWYFIEFLHQQEGGMLVSGNVPVWLLVWAPNLVLVAASAAMLTFDARLKPSRS